MLEELTRLNLGKAVARKRPDLLLKMLLDIIVGSSQREISTSEIGIL
jgi:hypothetical protein